MDEVLSVESAWSDGKLIGWRLKTPDDCLLVWKDQTLMKGFRVGPNFTPDIGETIEYRQHNIGFEMTNQRADEGTV